MNAIEAFNHAGLLRDGPVAAATCPSSSLPTAILIGAMHGPEALLCYNLIVLCRKKGNKWVLSDTGSLGNHAFPLHHGLRTDLLT